MSSSSLHSAFGASVQASIAELARTLEHPEPVAVEFAIMALDQLGTGSVDCEKQLVADFRREHYIAPTCSPELRPGRAC